MEWGGCLVGEAIDLNGRPDEILAYMYRRQASFTRSLLRTSVHRACENSWNKATYTYFLSLRPGTLGLADHVNNY